MAELKRQRVPFETADHAQPAMSIERSNNQDRDKLCWPRMQCCMVVRGTSKVTDVPRRAN